MPNFYNDITNYVVISCGYFKNKTDYYFAQSSTYAISLIQTLSHSALNNNKSTY